MILGVARRVQGHEVVIAGADGVAVVEAAPATDHAAGPFADLDRRPTRRDRRDAPGVVVVAVRHQQARERPAAEGGGDLADYLASLERLKALEPARIYPGHGPIVDRPVDLIDEYLAHRALRDRQILACLADGVTDVNAIVERIYSGVPAAVWPAARLTVQAHLRKLGRA